MEKKFPKTNEIIAIICALLPIGTSIDIYSIIILTVIITLGTSVAFSLYDSHGN